MFLSVFVVDFNSILTLKKDQLAGPLRRDNEDNISVA